MRLVMPATLATQARLVTPGPQEILVRMVWLDLVVLLVLAETQETLVVRVTQERLVTQALVV